MTQNIREQVEKVVLQNQEQKHSPESQKLWQSSGDKTKIIIESCSKFEKGRISMEEITISETLWDILGKVYNSVYRLKKIENILGDEYDLEHLKELVEKDKSQKSSSVYNHLPEEGQEVWYWDSHGISRGIVEFTNDTLNEFTVDFPDENDADIFYGCAWGDCIVASREEALEKMREGEK